VVVHNLSKSAVPAPGREDLAVELRDCANLNPHKNGILVFVHPLFAAQELLRVTVSDTYKEEAAACPDAPDDYPAYDDQICRGTKIGHGLLACASLRQAVTFVHVPDRRPASMLIEVLIEVVRALEGP
jgi:hypothetical protein